ncbi:MAG: hypothetical protein K0R52_294 [Alphaproteobacteria bacterium]|jgi:hypothetical protein|nr:hypothetical protein [Alphaproteobacteria bacterium]
MKKNLKLLVSRAFVVFTISTLWAVHGMEHDQKSPPGMQLNKGAGNTLESVLGTGNNVMLKMSMNLNDLGTPLGIGQPDLPVRLFLTDFMSSPTQHPPVDFRVKVRCESTPPACMLPDKPESFNSYDQFTDWLNKGYFVNQIKVTYDFQVDIQQSAPSLARHLFFVPPGGYRFTGIYAVENATMKPSQCVPQAAWSSKRGDENTTTVTLGGTFYLNDRPYPVAGHNQVFPHSVVEQVVFKRDDARQFYTHKWLARSEVTARVTYREFPDGEARNWPNAPLGTYSLLKSKPDGLEEINHLACWDGSNGNEVDISDGRVFSVVCEAINKPRGDNELQESIIKDGAGNLYTVRYQYTEAEQVRRAAAVAALRDEEQRKENARFQQEAEKQARKDATYKREIEETQKRIEDLENKLAEIEKREAERIRKLAQEAAEEEGKKPEGPEVPLIARGHEETYRRFLNGALIYRPQQGSDVGWIVMRIAELANPLAGTFNLSQCGIAGQYLRICTGYRKEIIPDNPLERKLEIWLTPRFLIEKELNASASHFQQIYDKWSERHPVGIFWAYSAWGLEHYDYLTNNSLDGIGSNNLYEKMKIALRCPSLAPRVSGILIINEEIHSSHFMFIL